MSLMIEQLIALMTYDVCAQLWANQNSAYVSISIALNTRKFHKTAKN